MIFLQASTFFGQALEALSDVADSPLALAGYGVVIAAFAFTSFNIARLRQIRYLPEKQRIEALRASYGPLPQGVTAGEYMVILRTRYVFLTAMAVLLVIVVLAGMAAQTSTTESRIRAQHSATVATLSRALRGAYVITSNAQDQGLEDAAAAMTVTMAQSPSAEGYLALGSLHEELGNTAEATRAYRAATESPSLDMDQSAVARINLGMILIDQNLDVAEAELRRGLEMASNGETTSRPLQFIALSNLGIVNFERAGAAQRTERQHLLATAINFYTRADALRGEAPSRDHLARFWANWANALAATGNLNRAAEVMGWALELKRELAASQSLAITLLNASDIDRQRGDLDAADDKILEAVALSEQLESGYLSRAVDAYRGVQLCARGHTAEGEALLRRAASDARREGDLTNAAGFDRSREEVCAAPGAAALVPAAPTGLLPAIDAAASAPRSE